MKDESIHIQLKRYEQSIMEAMDVTFQQEIERETLAFIYERQLIMSGWHRVFLEPATDGNAMRQTILSWLTENCKEGTYQVFTDRVLFNKMSDVALFKMVWG